jgi:hypothetical protein
LTPLLTNGTAGRWLTELSAASSRAGHQAERLAARRRLHQCVTVDEFGICRKADDLTRCQPRRSLPSCKATRRRSMPSRPRSLGSTRPSSISSCCTTRWPDQRSGLHRIVPWPRSSGRASSSTSASPTLGVNISRSFWRLGLGPSRLSTRSRCGWLGCLRALSGWADV